MELDNQITNVAFLEQIIEEKIPRWIVVDQRRRKNGHDQRESPQTNQRWNEQWNELTNLVPRVSHLLAPGGGKMRDPGNEVVNWLTGKILDNIVIVVCLAQDQDSSARTIWRQKDVFIKTSRFIIAKNDSYVRLK